MRLFQPLDYSFLLLIPVDTNDTTKGDLEHIKSDCMALGDEGQGYEGPGCISSILLVKGKGLERS